MMKRFAAVLMAVLLVASMSVSALATDTTEISLTVDPSMEHYTLTIPATVQIDPIEKSGTVSIELSDVALVWHTSLYVTASSKNHVEGESVSYLVNTSDESKKIAYRVHSYTGDNYFSQDGIVTIGGASRSYDYDTGTYRPNAIISIGDLDVIVTGDYPDSGTYTDTLTFTVTLN